MNFCSTEQPRKSLSLLLVIAKKYKYNSEKYNCPSYIYSWPSLVWPYTEELISRPFVGENGFWLVLQARMGPENAIGWVVVPSHSLLFWLPEVGRALGKTRPIFKRICSKTTHMDFSSEQFCISFIFLVMWVICAIILKKQSMIVKMLSMSMSIGWFWKGFSHHDQYRFVTSAVLYLLYISFGSHVQWCLFCFCSITDTDLLQITSLANSYGQLCWTMLRLQIHKWEYYNQFVTSHSSTLSASPQTALHISSSYAPSIK